MISYSIYIVDDEETIREGLTMALEAAYQVKAFSRAETAIKTIRSNPPDLILLDIGLPGISGIEALDEIKKRAANADILVEYGGQGMTEGIKELHLTSPQKQCFSNGKHQVDKPEALGRILHVGVKFVRCGTGNFR